MNHETISMEQMRDNALRLGGKAARDRELLRKRCKQLEVLLREAEINFGHLIPPRSLMDKIRAALSEEMP
jgi:hypothetical protein